jgi:tRNA pseudouridine13 synthase
LKKKVKAKSKMESSSAEKNIGIEAFLTSKYKIGGKLRFIPEDFIVKEASSYPTKKEDGRFVIADVTAKNWETNILVRELSDRLHMSRDRVSFAGTKDKRAQTTRLMSFYNISIDELSNVKIKDVEIENIYRSDRPIKLGNLIGNRFEIVIRKIDPDIKSKQIQEIVSVITKNGGFPNFYGVQRFGIIRPITHIVGKYIVLDDFEKAVMSYIANPIVGEDEDNHKLRTRLQKTYDFSEALASYPNELNFEKAILNGLVVNPKDFVGALKQLPNNLLTMFVYAYQSYLFNRILSERIGRDLPLNKAIEGDVILPLRNGAIDENGIFTTKNNIEKVNAQVSKGKAFVGGILIGYASEFAKGEMGEIEHKIIDTEKLNLKDFVIPEIPNLSSSGARRPILAPVKNLEFKLNDDELNKNNFALTLKFELQKGSYATSLLREFMKSDDVRDY